MSTTELVDALPADPILERRALVQATARRSLGRRNFVSKVMLTLCGFALAISIAILAWIIYLLISKGLQYWSIDFFTKDPSYIPLQGVGGIKNAIVGSFIIVGTAVVIAVPIGIIAGLLLAESDSPFMSLVRSTTEVMTGLPSILLGVFVYEILLIKFHVKFSGWLGTVALAILMIPIIMKAAEVALRGVPGSIKEAGLSLGMSKGTVSRRITIPTATSGLLTAVLLATSRAVGETAPLVLLIGNTYFTQWDLTKENTSLPTSIYQQFLNGTSSATTNETWGIALFLVAVVLVLNLAARLVTLFIQRERR